MVVMPHSPRHSNYRTHPGAYLHTVVPIETFIIVIVIEPLGGQKLLNPHDVNTETIAIVYT
jgi:hypothetical protein